MYETALGTLTHKDFEFFFWFARFEAALKESGFLKSETEGDIAEPTWEKFVEVYTAVYTPTKSGKRLLELGPERQIVDMRKKLARRPVGTGNCRSELCQVVKMLKTLRNNVFHGGKKRWRRLRSARSDRGPIGWHQRTS